MQRLPFGNSDGSYCRLSVASEAEAFAYRLNPFRLVLAGTKIGVAIADDGSALGWMVATDLAKVQG